jgi:hypothetical protein
MISIEIESYLKTMEASELKQLWDAYDGTNAPGGFSGEAIHLELNARGLGEYCAI